MARRLILALVCALATTACAKQAVVTSTQLSGATTYTGAWIREDLYFGRMSPTGLVSDSAFNAFVELEVVRRLPEGFTLLDGIGYWRGANGRTIREPARVLIVHYRDAEREKPRLLTELIVLYKRMFNQESVLRVVLPARVTF